MAEQKKKQLKKKADKKNGTKIIPLTGKEKNEEDIDEDEEDSGGIYLEKEDVKIIYNALKEYKPTQKERQRFELLVEGCGSFRALCLCHFTS
jgi:hypothetical protein